MESGELTQLSADKNVEQLSEEELHCVLKQLIDHSLPDSEKCPLVRRLNAEDALASNNTSFKLQPASDTPVAASSNSSRSSFKPRGRPNHRESGGDLGGGGSSRANQAPPTHSRGDKLVNYAQYFPEPPRPATNNNHCDDSLNLSAAISNTNTEIVAAGHLRTSGGSNRKPNRAKSFTMPSPNDNSSKSDTSVKILDHHLTNGTEVRRDSLRPGDKQTLSASLPVSGQRGSSSPSISASPQSCSNSSHYLLSDTAHHTHSNKSSSHHFSSVHLASINSLVEGLKSDSANNHYSRYQQERRDLNKSNNQSLTVQEEDEEKLEFGEMKNLHSDINYSYYSSDFKLQNYSNSDNKHNVDKTLEMPMLTNKSDESSDSNNQGTVALPPISSLNSTSAATNGIRLKKKKRPQEKVKLSEQIDGYIGYIQDLSYLESFVNNNLADYEKNSQGKNTKNEIDIRRRAKRNNGDIAGAQIENDIRDLSITNKMPLSNSSSLSGDDMTVIKNVNGGLVKSNTSPEESRTNRTKPKKSKSKNKQDKNNNKVNSTKMSPDGFENESGFNKSISNKSRKDNDIEKEEETKSNSSLDSTDTEDGEPVVTFPRSKKSNSLLPSQNIPLQEDDNLYTVSDSEMADREKGFVTPKNKHFKKRKNQQLLRQHMNENTGSQRQTSKNLSFSSNANGVHNLGRGYESEREYSLNNCLNPKSIASQSVSSSMLAINSRISDKRSVCTLSPPTNQDSNPLLSEPTDLFGDSDLGLSLPPTDTQESGPKMPSYADIAKSFNQPACGVKNSAIASKPLTTDNPSAVEEFPQLDLQSSNDSHSSTSATDSVLDTSNFSANMVSKQISPSKADSQPKEDSCKMEMLSPQSISSVIKEEPETDCAFEITSPLNNIASEPQEDVSEFSCGEQPVIIFGDNSILTAQEEIPTNCDHSTENNAGNKLVFGFFEESEISIIEQADDGSLNESFNELKNSDSSQSNKFEDAPDSGHSDFNAVQMCASAQLDESFLKNALLVNDVEDTMLRKLDIECVQVASQSLNQAAYSSSASSPLSSSFDSSPASSSSGNTNSTNFAAEAKPFVSCVDSLQNYKFIDNVDSNSFNYSNVIQYVSKSWKLCNSNLQGF